MNPRVGLGPVFFYESLVAARRWQGYALRALFVSLLLASLGTVWWGKARLGTTLSPRQLAAIGETFFYALVGTQLVLVLLAAPAATAGAVCLDRARGTLLHLLVTDLSDAEVVLGKLGARAAPALGLVTCALPVMMLATLLGGVDPQALLGALLITVGVAVLGCALALTLSVWGTKTHEVLLATYLVWGVWLMAEPMWRLVSNHTALSLGPPPDWLVLANPFYLAFSPYTRPGRVGLGSAVLFLAATLFLSAILVAVAVLNVRRVAVTSGGPPKARRRGRLGRLVRIPIRLPRLPGPPLDFNPVLWREWHRSRPSRWARVSWTIFGIGALTFSAIAAFSDGRQGTAAWVNGLQVSVGLLLLSVGAATALAEERVRGSLDVLLATPLPTRSIVMGKWWGAFRVVPWLALLPALVVAFSTALAPAPAPAIVTPPATVGGAAIVVRPAAPPAPADWATPALLIAALILAQGAAITSLGLALATWVSRLGRAVGLTVSAYILVSVGWMFLILALWSSGPWTPAPGRSAWELLPRALLGGWALAGLGLLLAAGGDRLWSFGMVLGAYAAASAAAILAVAGLAADLSGLMLLIPALAFGGMVLAAAARWRRSSRVLAAAPYALVVAGVLFTLVALGGAAHRRHGEGLMMASGFFGAGNLTFSAARGDNDFRDEIVPWTIAWTSIYAQVAAALLVATLASFNRLLGRMDDKQWPVVSGQWSAAGQAERRRRSHPPEAGADAPILSPLTTDH